MIFCADKFTFGSCQFSTCQNVLTKMKKFTCIIGWQKIFQVLLNLKLLIQLSKRVNGICVCRTSQSRLLNVTVELHFTCNYVIVLFILLLTFTNLPILNNKVLPMHTQFLKSIMYLDIGDFITTYLLVLFNVKFPFRFCFL